MLTVRGTVYTNLVNDFFTVLGAIYTLHNYGAERTPSCMPFLSGPRCQVRLNLLAGVSMMSRYNADAFPSVRAVTLFIMSLIFKLRLHEQVHVQLQVQSLILWVLLKSRLLPQPQILPRD
jgi:hypothetical protein